MNTIKVCIMYFYSKCILFDFAIPISGSYLYNNKTLKVVLRYKITFLICVCVVNSQRLYYSNNLVLNVAIKAFWYANRF